MGTMRRILYLLPVLLFMALAWWVDRRTQAWKHP